MLYPTIMASVFALIAGLIYAFVTGKNKSDKGKPTPEQLKRVNKFKWIFLVLFFLFLIIASLPLISLLQGGTLMIPGLISITISDATIDYSIIIWSYIINSPYILGTGFLYYHFRRIYNTYAPTTDSGA